MKSSTFTSLLVAILSLPFSIVHAQTTWTGTVDNSWNNAANWSAGLPSIDPLAPIAVIFDTNDLNADTLTLDGNFYLNALTINIANYGNNKTFASGPGSLTFAASGGLNPVFNLSMLSTTTNASRNITLSNSIILEDNLTFTRIGGGTATATRRVIFGGIISGDAGLIIDNQSNSNTGRIEFNEHNTFTGNVDIKRGYVTLAHSDSLGTGPKTISVASLNQVTMSIATTAIGAITYDFDIGNSKSTTNEWGAMLLQFDTPAAARQIELTGNITGAAALTSEDNSIFAIAQGSQQIIFSGSNSTFGGRFGARHGSEFVIAGANSSNVAWQNVLEVSLGRSITSTVTTTNNNSAFVLRGDYTFNAPIHIIDQDNTTGTDVSSIGQINHQGTSYNAIFNGSIDAREDDYRSLNLVSESGGSATFKAPIIVTGAQGLDINKIINTVTSGGTLNYYEARPTGTVIIDASSRVASTSIDTGSIGIADIRNGTLVVNTEEFYGSATVHSGARLAGLGKITGNISVLGGALLEPGFGVTNPSFTSNEGTFTVTGSVTLAAEAAILFQASSASFNVGFTSIANIALLPSTTLQQLGAHDFLSISADLSIAQAGALRLAFTNNYIPVAGDVFHLLDYQNLLFTSLDPIAIEALWNLPNLAALNPSLAWNFDLFESHGFLVVSAAAVPEPSRLLLFITALFIAITHRRKHLH